ncbi:hypothetical protein HELRODRAFT_162405 [Helobdella robusta]|uniref:UspA domain-containing protein n=1 Tax=Helobdella robusta TaxID=6412 RepID=T1ESM0_HELRO|nr:hypothetical protein HELRODRAFT_162405 [Helobdella robusta]ESN98935.1 hypothetical protein HELRODRAFT_162405 [Helobdella robusta]
MWMLEILQNRNLAKQMPLHHTQAECNARKHSCFKCSWIFNRKFLSRHVPLKCGVATIWSAYQLQALLKSDAHDQFGSQSSLRLWDQNRSRIKAIDNKYRWKLNENRLPGKIRTEAGNPSDIILQVAQEENAGLIVIGSRGLSKIKTTLFGSVSDHVLHHSKCPVLICRENSSSSSKETKTKK